MNIDEWSASQCGVNTRPNNDPWKWKIGGVTYKNAWTLDDARCREIVREHFKITTVYLNYGNKGNWRSLQGSIDGIAKTIAEAEINCIKAIREAL